MSGVKDDFLGEVPSTQVGLTLNMVANGGVSALFTTSSSLSFGSNAISSTRVVPPVVTSLTCVPLGILNETKRLGPSPAKRQFPSSSVATPSGPEMLLLTAVPMVLSLTPAKGGDAVDVVVLDIKPSDRRVSLGMKQAQPDPWLLTAEKYPVGTVITGKVRNIAEFGAFVEIEDGFDGLVHVGDVSWTGRVKNPHEVFKKGEPVTAKVLKIDAENRRVSLGIKQVNDIWGEWFKQHRIGQIVKGKVSRIATFGAFVELGENIEALCHNTEIEDRRRRDEGMGGYRPTGPLKSAGPLEPGKEYDFKIIKISPDTRRIGLSYRAAVKQLERKEIEQYLSSSKSSSTATIGDALKSKLSAR